MGGGGGGGGGSIWVGSWEMSVLRVDLLCYLLAFICVVCCGSIPTSWSPQIRFGSCDATRRTRTDTTLSTAITNGGKGLRVDGCMDWWLGGLHGWNSTQLNSTQLSSCLTLRGRREGTGRVDDKLQTSQSDPIQQARRTRYLRVTFQFVGAEVLRVGARCVKRGNRWSGRSYSD